MRRRPAVRSFRPALESLEGRDLPSNLPLIAQQFLVPLAQEIAANSNSALTRLQADDSFRTSVVTAASHPTNNTAAAVFAEGASDLQAVLTQRRVLEISFIADLSFFAGVVQTESLADQAADNAAFVNIETTFLNPPRQQVTANENTALALGIVNNGINTIGTPGFVVDNTGINSPVNIDITYPPLRPSLGAGIVFVPVYNYSSPFLPSPPYVPPSNNP